MKLLRKLLLGVSFLYGIAASGTTLRLEPDKNHIIHDVAHPRACVLIDMEGIKEIGRAKWGYLLESTGKNK